LFAWAGNRTADGGFHRIRATGKPIHLPVELHARTNSVELKFTEALDPASANDPQNFAVKVWSLKRSANYGSPHVNEHALTIRGATLGPDRKTIVLNIPDLAPTWCMEIKASLHGADGAPFSRTLHNTIHQLGPAVTPENR
jgi:hypothetical protein